MFLKINKLKFQIRKIIVGSSIFVVLILLLFGIKWIISNHLLDSQSAYSLFILSLSKTIESGDYSTEDLYWRGTLYRGIVLKKSLKLSKSKYSKEGKDKRTERLNKYYILALNDFNAVLEIDPNYKDTNIQKIDVLTDLKRHDEALEECDKILQGDAENIKILEKKAMINIYIKNLDIAKRLYKELTEKDEENINYFQTYITLCSITNDTATALNESLKRIKEYPEQPSGYYQAGCIYSKMKNFHNALEYFSKAIEIDSTHAPSYQSRSKVYARINDKENAQKDSLKTIELMKTN